MTAHRVDIVSYNKELYHHLSTMKLKDIPHASKPADTKSNPWFPLCAKMKTLFPEVSCVITRRIGYIQKNLLSDMLFHPTCLYPIMGFFEVLKDSSYWKHLFLSSVCYVIIFIIIGFFYYILFLPIMIIWAIFLFGPIGIILAHFEWLFYTNSLTGIICKTIVLSRLNDQIFDMALYLNNQNQFLLEAKYVRHPLKPRDKMHWTKPEFWMNDVASRGCSVTRKISISIALTIVSLIPIIGPFISNQLISPRRAYSYMHRYFILKGEDEKKNKDFQYEHLGKFIYFGATAGIMEFIPGASIITMTTNTVGAAKWAAAIIEKSKK